MLVESGKVNRSEVQSALMEQEHVRNLRKKRTSRQESTSEHPGRLGKARFPGKPRGRAGDRAGQAHPARSLQGQTPTSSAWPRRWSSLTAELRDNAMGIRMLPIGTTFAKFKRLVRDLSAELGKEIDFTTEGEETELDKTVIEKLVRPAGAPHPEQHRPWDRDARGRRTSSGKPAAGHHPPVRRAFRGLRAHLRA